MLFTENAANSSLCPQGPVLTEAKLRKKQQHGCPQSPCSHNFCLAQADGGINHAYEAFAWILEFLVNFAFFI
jgi:hypothetical protein